MAPIDARRISLLLGGIAIVSAATLSGCSAKTSEKPAPANSAPQVMPSEKKVPTLSPNGPNQIAPSGNGPVEPSALPGNGTSGTAGTSGH